MSLVNVSFPNIYPPGLNNVLATFSGSNGGPGNASATIDAAGEKIAFVGQIYWQGEPTGAKTVSSSGKIKIRTATVTFADAATTLRVGIQDVLTTGANFMTPDGTFDVYADYAGNSGTPLSSASDFTYVEFPLTTGSKSIAHGNFIALVFDMTARGGTDSVQIAGPIGAPQKLSPNQVHYTTSWATTQVVPCALLTADDGTVGVLFGSFPWATDGVVTFADASTPDEYGLVFKVPYRCKVAGVIVNLSTVDENSNFDLTLYSTPLGTPAAMATISVDGAFGNPTATEAGAMFMFASAVTLEANTDYCVALKATGTSNILLSRVDLLPGAETIGGYANCSQGTRSNGSGSFSTSTPIMPQIGVVITALDDGTGGGRASFNLGI